ncbi:MAG: 2-phospho-L-lactate transferase [Caldilineaceae bacterium]|nr:2-phospho-L-lactate transferase [Caldilineaceae bacterium]
MTPWEEKLLGAKVVALAGGVGGAKLAAGLQAVLPPGALTVIVNTGDDFEHWGLTVCPDLDTVTYNLADVHDPEMGWGRRDESYQVLETMSSLGGEDWFRLGDKDLALHLRRSEWLRQQISLTEVTDRLRRSFGVPSTILPMCNEPVRTLVHTSEGDLPFQHYFVRRRCEPIVIDISFVGAADATLTHELLHALEQADLIVFCPSNPYLSIDPILSLPGLRRMLRKMTTPRVAVSPIVGGRALKGPAAKMMREMGHMMSPLTVADHLDGLIDGMVIDEEDRALEDSFDQAVRVTDTIMTDLAGKTRLAGEVLDFGLNLTRTQAANPADISLAP